MDQSCGLDFDQSIHYSNQIEENIKLADQILPIKEEAELKLQGLQRKKKIRLTMEKVQEIISAFHEYQKLKLSRKMTLATVGQKLDISHTLLYKLWRQFQKDSTLKQTRDFILNIKKPPRRGLSKSTENLQDWIKPIIDQNPFLTTHEIAAIMNGKFGEKPVHQQTVLRVLKLSGYSYKSISRVPIYRNSPQNIQARYKYAIRYQDIRLLKTPIYFVDLINFNSQLKHTHGWSLNGQPISLPKIQFKHPNLSILCLLGIDGLACWHVCAGKFSKKEFIESLKMLIEPSIAQIKDKTKSTKQRVAINSIGQQLGLQILQLPPHSSLLNPIQAWFYELKLKIKKNDFSSQQNLTQSMASILKAYQKHDFKSYFKNVDWYIKNSLQKQVL